jgi:lysyl-tRNA synthetase class 2
MLEWYRVGADYKNIMEDFEKLFIEIIKTVKPNTDLNKWQYQNEIYDISLPWPRMSVSEAFEKYCGINKDILLSTDLLLQKAKDKGYQIDASTTWEQAFYQIFFNEIEPQMKESNKPTFIYDYPLSQAALARVKKDDPRFAERFEIFLAGIELGNCFSELTNAEEQKERFINDLAERNKLGKTQYPMDNDFLEALKAGMPEVAGIAVGVDRLIMLAQDTDKISDTLFFPAKEMFEL